MPTQVLIVDDEPTLRRILRFVFSRAGFVVREARDGNDALEQLRQQPAELIVLDLMMPVMSGFQALQELRADPSICDARVIILTAKGQDADRNRAFELGADEFMTKPFSAAEVAHRGQALLAKGPHEGELLAKGPGKPSI